MFYIEDVEVKVIRKNIKSIRLRVLRQDGSVVVSAPSFVSDKRVLEFVKSKIDWIKRQKELVDKEKNLLKYISGESIKIFGKEYVLIVNQGNREMARIFDGQVLLTVENTNDYEAKKNCLDILYKKLVTEKIYEKLPLFEGKMGLKSSSFTVRKMKTRWGSCNTKTRKLCFNSELAKKEEECINYVIIHELCHIKYANHKKEFWKFLEGFLPNYKIIKNELNDK